MAGLSAGLTSATALVASVVNDPYPTTYDRAPLLALASALSLLITEINGIENPA